MASISITIKQDNAQVAMLLKRLVQLQPIYERWALILHDTSDRAFQTQSDANTGRAWAAWSQSYAKRLLKKGKAGKKVLISSSTLFKSRQMFFSPRRGGVGTNLAYARIHQLGGGSKKDSRGRIMNTPARPYLGADERAKRKLLAAFKDYLQDA